MCLSLCLKLLTYKCVNGTASEYLCDLVTVRKRSEQYDFRHDNVAVMLQLPYGLHYTRSNAIFSYASAKVWNALPLHIRELSLSVISKVV